MRLVDDEEPDPAGNVADECPKTLVRQAFRRDEKDVDLVLPELLLDLVPVVRVGAVDCRCGHPESRGGAELVAHQGEQRTDQDRRPEPLLAQKPSRKEVHDTLPPARPFDDENPPPFVDEGQHGFKLAVAETGVLAERRPQEVAGPSLSSVHRVR